MTTPNDQPLTEEEITRLQTAWMGHRDFQNELFRSGKALPPREQERLNNVLAAYESYAIESLPRLLSELRHLRGIVGKLPTTADGIPITPGMELFYREATWPMHAGINQTIGEYNATYNESFPANECYSTREAALAHPTDSGGGLNLDAKENK